MTGLVELENYTGQLLEAARFRDYCPNGLQVEGRPQVGHLVSGVSASLALLEAAIAAGADAILVHHGYFWRNEPAPIVGLKRRRLALLLKNEVSLLAYHLPLDAHAQLGNNAQLAGLLGFETEGWFGEQSIAAYGRLSQPLPLSGLAAEMEHRLARKPLVIGDDAAIIRRIAWCSGAAQDYLDEAVNLGVDAFVTGEVSERTVHLARESGVAFISAGHHATERYGVKALGDHLARHFGLKHSFIDIPNPV
jgi:dinuclear metal center YbgI/SA1388 family protein